MTVGEAPRSSFALLPFAPRAAGLRPPCYYQDGLGSTTHIADGSGNLLESYRYDLYGTPGYYDQNGQLKANQVSGYGVNDLYVGERWVSELRVYDLRNRFMSPELGRFLQPDSIGFKGDASNLYRYCHNDSVDRVDPLGFTDLCYVGGYTKADWRIRDALDKTINPKEVISVGAHASPTEMRNTTVKPSVPLTVKQVVQDIRNLDKFKNNPNMP
jgi:RHS repeat-associated protein